MTELAPRHYPRADTVSRAAPVSHFGGQPVFIGAAALAIIVLGIGSIVAWRAYTGTSPELDRVASARQLQARTAQLPGALAQRPTVVSIWLAVNDMNATIEPASFASDLGAIVDALVSGTEAKIFVGNVPDLRPVPAYKDADKAALFKLIGAYNAAIAAIATRYPGRVFAVDLFTGSADLVSTITVSGDGFHPSDAGYQLIADRFAAAMRSGGVPLR